MTNNDLQGLGSLLKSLTFELPNALTLSVFEVGDGWWVHQRIGGGNVEVRLMDGTKAGGTFHDLEAALAEVHRIFDYYRSPLVRKEIVHCFPLKRIQREEQATALLGFRSALLSHNWKMANRLARHFTSWTWEAIPAKVRYHLTQNGFRR